MSASSLEDLLALHRSGRLAVEMARRFGLTDANQISAMQALCVEAHNGGWLDLIELAENDFTTVLDNSSFFSASHFFGKLLPDLQGPAPKVMACVETLVTRGGADFAANMPNAAFREWCAKDAARAQEVLSAALIGDELALRHLTFALEALSDVAAARKLLCIEDEKLRLSAITALGRLNDRDAQSRAETINAFWQLLDRGVDDVTRACLLSASIFVVTQECEVDLPEGVELVRRLVQQPSDEMMYQVARVLSSYPVTRHSALIRPLLDALLHLNPTHKGTVEALDVGLQALMNGGHGDAAIGLVTRLFEESGELRLTELGSFLGELVEGPVERLGATLVSWLHSGNLRLCDGLAQKLRRQQKDDPVLVLDDHLRDLPAHSQIFVCRKAIGFFFMQPRTAASVLVSALRVCTDVATADEIQAHLVEWLLLNYGCVRDYLSEISESDPAKVLVSSALAENKAYLENLHSLPELKEFRPSERHRNIEAQRMEDEMRAATKDAHSQSIFFGLVKRSILLYGSRSLSFVRDGGDHLRPMEMDLKPFSVSVELPRLELIDPVGLDYALRRFRGERMVP